MVYRYKKDTICFKMVSFFDLLPLASVNKVSVFNDFEYFFINTHLMYSGVFLHYIPFYASSAWPV